AGVREEPRATPWADGADTQGGATPWADGANLCPSFGTWGGDRQRTLPFRRRACSPHLIAPPSPEGRTEDRCGFCPGRLRASVFLFLIPGQPQTVTEIPKNSRAWAG